MKQKSDDHPFPTLKLATFRRHGLEPETEPVKPSTYRREFPIANTIAVVLFFGGAAALSLWWAWGDLARVSGGDWIINIGALVVLLAVLAGWWFGRTEPN